MSRELMQRLTVWMEMTLLCSRWFGSTVLPLLCGLTAQWSRQRSQRWRGKNIFLTLFLHFFSLAHQSTVVCCDILLELIPRIEDMNTCLVDIDEIVTNAWTNLLLQWILMMSFVKSAQITFLSWFVLRSSFSSDPRRQMPASWDLHEVARNPGIQGLTWTC